MILKKVKGQALMEYLILVALVVVASLGVLEVLGNSLRSRLALISSKIQGRNVDDYGDVEAPRERHYRNRTMRNFWKTND